MDNIMTPAIGPQTQGDSSLRAALIRRVAFERKAARDSRAAARSLAESADGATNTSLARAHNQPAISPPAIAAGTANEFSLRKLGSPIPELRLRTSGDGFDALRFCPQVLVFPAYGDDDSNGGEPREGVPRDGLIDGYRAGVLPNADDTDSVITEDLDENRDADLDADDDAYLEREVVEGHYEQGNAALDGTYLRVPSLRFSPYSTTAVRPGLLSNHSDRSQRGLVADETVIEGRAPGMRDIVEGEVDFLESSRSSWRSNGMILLPIHAPPPLLTDDVLSPVAGLLSTNDSPSSD